VGGAVRADHVDAGRGSQDVASQSFPPGVSREPMTAGQAPGVLRTIRRPC
jgi:hypothetical protein